MAMNQSSTLTSRFFGTPDDKTLLLARIGLGIVMLPHGAQKLLGWFGGPGLQGTVQFMGTMGIPAPLAYLVVIGEFFGALGLVFGFLTRVSAVAIGAILTVAAIKVHAPVGFFMNWAGTAGGEGFEFHILAVALASVLAIKGAGAWSLDRAIAQKSSSVDLVAQSASA